MLLLEANIPEFLRSSPYLQSLLSNGPFPEEGLEIPDGSGKQDLTVNSKADLIELLSTLRFWLVPEVAEQSSDLLVFAFLPTTHADFVEVAAEFRKDIPLIDELLQILNSSEEKRLEMAAGFGRLPVVRFFHLGGSLFHTSTIQAAARAGHFEYAKYIVDSSPATCEDSPASHRLLVEAACKSSAEYGHLACVKQMLAEWGATYSTAAVIGAAEGNHLEVLKYASGVGHDQSCVEDAMIACVLKGYLECLEYLHSLGYEQDSRLMALSAEEGHLDCLKFLHEHNYPAGGVCFGAASHGRLECLKYVHEQGMPWDEYACLVAAERGHLECLRYTHEHGCPWWDRPAVADLPVNSRNMHCTNRVKVAVHTGDDDEDEVEDEELIAASACRAPTIDCLLYVLEQGAALSLACVTIAVCSKSLATLQFLHARGFTWEASDCETAVYFGSFECVRFLHEIGTPWDARCTLHVGVHVGEVYSSSLEVLEYLHTHGCPWHTDTCLSAAQFGNLECLQYAHERGAPWTSEVCRFASSMECYEYAVANGCPGAKLNEKFVTRKQAKI